MTKGGGEEEGMWLMLLLRFGGGREREREIGCRCETRRDEVAAVR
jgi:hypothetical protein